MKLDSKLESADIFLRSLNSSDVSIGYLAWLSDPEINASLEVRFAPTQTLNALELFITDINASSNNLLLGIFLQKSNDHIGNIKLGPIDWNHLTGDIGFLIGEKKQWGKGYASQSIALLVKYAFETLGLAKLTAGCYAENEGSRQALLKAGFLDEGRRKSQWISRGKRQDGILMGLVNPVF
jgi:ribosomal-protein-alanine N-acetyltransferase